MPNHVFFHSDHRLEGILEEPPTDHLVGGVVVAHPHPEHGGTMAQPLVFRMARACRDRGMAVLRFNFRGVGRSQGLYDGVAESRDVQAAVSFLRERLEALSRGDRYENTPVDPGYRLPLGMAGYSFGSVMSARAIADCGPVDALALLALVIRWEGLAVSNVDALAAFGGPVLAICGEEDHLIHPTEIDWALNELNADYRIKIVKGADHFFRNHKREVGELVGEFMEETFSRIPKENLRSDHRTSW